MKKKLEELVFILDKSGSMSGKEDDTIGSFNSIINEHKDKDYDVFVTTVLFSSTSYTLHDRLDIKEVDKMTRSQYSVNGCTALIDAMGQTISRIKDIQCHQRRKEDIPEHTMIVIITDGMENASTNYTSDAVKQMVERQKECGWEFLFLGANIDAVETAKKFSIDESRAVNYINDSKGINEVSNFVKKSSKRYFKQRPGMRLEANDIMFDRYEIDEDFSKRSNRKK